MSEEGNIEAGQKIEENQIQEKKDNSENKNRAKLKFAPGRSALASVLATAAAFAGGLGIHIKIPHGTENEKTTTTMVVPEKPKDISQTLPEIYARLSTH